MRSEEPNQNRSAAQKLEALDQVPEGFRFRQAAVWEGLEAGLQPAPKQRRFRWWYAAAILIGIGISVPLFFLQKEGPKPAPIAIKTGNPKIVEAPITTNATTTTVNAPAVKSVPKRKISSTLSTTTQTLSLHENIVEEKKMNVTVLPSPLPTESATVAEPVAESAPRSRFRVAHVNELRLPIIPAEVLNERSRNAYTFLGKPISVFAGEEKRDEQTFITKKPKTLFGIFSTSQ